MHISRLLGAITLGSCILGAPALAQAEQSPRGQVQLGADFGLTQRPAQANGAGVEYAPGITYGAHAQLLTARWLRFSFYYLHARQPLHIPGGALGSFDAVHPERDHLSSFVLGARVQPTLNLGERLHLWVSAGAGWGKVSAPAMQLDSATRSVRVDPRDGVLVELPFGVGGSLDIIDRWLAVSVDATYATQTNQSGALYSNVQAVDSSGHLVEVGPMPKLGPAMSAIASIVVEL